MSGYLRNKLFVAEADIYRDIRAGEDAAVGLALKAVDSVFLDTSPGGIDISCSLDPEDLCAKSFERTPSLLVVYAVPAG